MDSIFATLYGNDLPRWGMWFTTAVAVAVAAAFACLLLRQAVRVIVAPPAPLTWSRSPDGRHAMPTIPLSDRVHKIRASLEDTRGFRVGSW